MKSYLKTVKIMFSAKKSLLVKCFALVVMILFLTTLVPLYMEWLITRIQGGEEINRILLYLGGFVLLYALLCVCHALRAEQYAYLGEHILWSVREKIYRVLWHADYEKDVMNAKDRFKFAINTESFLMLAVTSVYSINLLINFLIMVVMLAVAAWINLYVFGILLLSIALTLFLSFFSGQRILTLYGRAESAQEEDAAVNYETVDMVETTRLNGLTAYFRKKCRASLEIYFQRCAASDRAEVFWTNVQGAVHSLVYILVAVMVMLSETVNQAQMITALFLTNRILEVSNAFQTQLQVVIKNIPVFDKVLALVDTPVEQGGPVDKIDTIRFDQAGLSYEDRNVFKQMSFFVKAGENVVVKGGNGSGKSSLLKLLTGLLKPDAGTVTVNDTDITSLDPDSLVSRICFASQDELFLNETVEDYLRVVADAQADDAAIGKLREHFLLHEEIRQITENGNSLSGGEKKKLLMMKCLLRKSADVVIMDEIDAGLDEKTRALLKETEKQFMNDPSVIFFKVSHIDADESGFQHVVTMG